MALGEQSLGLCLTCNSRAVCTRRKGIKLPVLFCEEFDDSMPLEVKSRPDPVIEEGERVPDRAMGLCCNCEKRGSCTLQNSPGGVWHCEEYR